MIAGFANPQFLTDVAVANGAAATQIYENTHGTNLRGLWLCNLDTTTSVRVRVSTDGSDCTTDSGWVLLPQVPVYLSVAQGDLPLGDLWGLHAGSSAIDVAIVADLEG